MGSEMCIRDRLKNVPPNEALERTQRLTAKLTNRNNPREHNTHFQIDECRDAGLEVVRLEDDQKLQDIVLTIHHCYMHTLSNTPALKIIENHLGRALVRQMTFNVMPPQFATPVARSLPIPSELAELIAGQVQPPGHVGEG